MAKGSLAVVHGLANDTAGWMHRIARASAHAGVLMIHNPGSVRIAWTRASRE